jgi:hypothetical protein
MLLKLLPDLDEYRAALPGQPIRSLSFGGSGGYWFLREAFSFIQLIQEEVRVELQVARVNAQEAAGLRQRRHGREIVFFQSAQIALTDAGCLGNLFQGERTRLPRPAELLTNRFCHAIMNLACGR